MGLRFLTFFPLLTIFSFAPALNAAPKLRLTSATVGPVTAAAGSNGPAQTVEAYNAGDGNLSLSVAVSSDWLSGSAGAPRACSQRSGSCIPLQFNLNTASLAAGTYTATATVSDPNAVDAPQTITVTVQVGGGVPGSITLYAPPGGTNDAFFTTNTLLGLRAGTQDGQLWLSVSLSGTGSFRFVYPYRVHVAPVAGQGEGTYNGTVTTSGSSFAGDNKTIAVTMQVTSQPIVAVQPDARLAASIGTDGIRLQLAQGAPRYDFTVNLSNLGLGTLQVSGAATGASWLSASQASPAAVTVGIDPSGLSPGTYNDSVRIDSNAANGPLQLPVQLTVAPAGPPVIRFQGVVDGAILNPGDAVAQGGIAAVIGDQLSMAAPAQGGDPPLATQVADAQVLVNGQPAPMFSSSYGQLVFQMPFEVPAGTAQVTVQRDGQQSNTVSVDVAERAPRLLLVGVGDFGKIENASQDGSRPMPASYQSFGIDARPAHRGDNLVLYAIGLGPTDPPVGSGQPAPADSRASLIVGPGVSFGSGPTATRVIPSFAGLVPGAAGLYRVEVTVPDIPVVGVVPVTLNFTDAISNVVSIDIE